RRESAERTAFAAGADPPALTGRTASAVGGRAAAGRDRRRTNAPGPLPAAVALADDGLCVALPAPAGIGHGERGRLGADAAPARGAGRAGGADLAAAAPDDAPAHDVEGRPGRGLGTQLVAAIASGHDGKGTATAGPCPAGRLTAPALYG